MAMVMENQQPLARMPLVPAPPPLPPPPPQAYYKHRCKVCKKGFVCGRALGGHMRAHGVADDTLSADDDAIDDGGGASSSEAGSAPPAAAATAKRMYALRANPGRLKSCRVCENCGKEFTSWKSLLDHGRCHYDEGEGDLDGDIGDGAGNNDYEEGDELVLAGGWSKGKRTRRAKVMVVGNGTITTEEQVSAPSSEEEDLANFLVMLSSSSSSSAARPRVVVEVDDQERCVASKKEQRNHHQPLLPQPISMIAPASSVPQLKLLAPPQVLPHHVSTTVPRGMFECKACKKVFTSHQALGGHRASHKKVKGCFAAKLESNNRNDPPQQPPVVVASASEKVIVDAIPAIIRIEQNITGVDGNAEGNTANNYGAAVAVMATAAPEMAAANEVVAAPSAAKKKGKVHECSICHRVFMSGQALGGHKRCHWLTAAGAGAGDPAVAKLHPYVTQDHVMHAMCQQLTLGRPAMFDAASDPFLDLNVPTATANPSPAAAAARQAAAELNDGVLSLTAPAASLYMQSWAAGHSKSINMNNTATSGHYYDAAAEPAATEDEADSTSAKRAKISDLKDMNMGGETSPWLQVGIGLPSEIDEEKQATQA